jgi:hypothetical protein
MAANKTHLAVIAGVCLGGAALLFTFNPSETGIFPPCPFHCLTGLYCPGCGSSRTVHFLLRGDIFSAFRMNPLLVVSIPILGLLCWRRDWLYKPWVPWVAFAALVLFAVLRNIPVFPLSFLAPH